MVNSWYDPDTGRVHAFEEQIGSHGGLGGEQARPFLMSPYTLSPPVADGQELAGAEQVHRVCGAGCASARGRRCRWRRRRIPGQKRKRKDLFRSGAPPTG